MKEGEPLVRPLVGEHRQVGLTYAHRQGAGAFHREAEALLGSGAGGADATNIPRFARRIGDGEPVANPIPGSPLAARAEGDEGAAAASSVTVQSAPDAVGGGDGGGVHLVL